MRIIWWAAIFIWIIYLNACLKKTSSLDLTEIWHPQCRNETNRHWLHLIVCLFTPLAILLTIKWTVDQSLALLQLTFSYSAAPQRKHLGLSLLFPGHNKRCPWFLLPECRGMKVRAVLVWNKQGYCLSFWGIFIDYCPISSIHVSIVLFILNLSTCYCILSSVKKKSLFNVCISEGWVYYSEGTHRGLAQLYRL